MDVEVREGVQQPRRDVVQRGRAWGGQRREDQAVGWRRVGMQFCHQRAQQVQRRVDGARGVDRYGVDEPFLQRRKAPWARRELSCRCSSNTSDVRRLMRKAYPLAYSDRVPLVWFTPGVLRGRPVPPEIFVNTVIGRGTS